MSHCLVRVYRAICCAFAVTLLVAPGAADAVRPSASVYAPLNSDDQVFLQLRAAARDNDAPRAAQLAARIPDYPAPSYLEYFQLKPQLFDALGHANPDAPDAPVQAFLQTHDGEAIADRLRNDWLLVLGARHDWTNFDQQYPRFVLNDDTQVKCYALESRAAKGENVADAARALLADPHSYGDGCVDLVSALASKGQFSATDVWQQIRQAYEDNQTTAGNSLVSALGAQRPDSGLFSQAVNAPSLTLVNGVGTDAQSHQLALLAVTALARTDPASAASAFAGIAPSLNANERAIGWGAIGYQAARKQQMPAAYAWFQKSSGAALSAPAYEWRTRAALVNGDWPMVLWSTEQMPATLRTQPAWAYWHARALKQTGGDAAQASQELAQVATNYNFYGQLATEELGRKITAPPSTPISDAEVDKVASTPAFALAQRFYGLNMRLEGNREWNWALRSMSDRQILAAAEYARRIQLYDRTVSTAERTQNEQDFSLRYLAPFRETVERDAQTAGIDPGWAYGLMRQESRFVMNARSGVGASGLMQLMPATAQIVARKLGLGTLSGSQLNDLDTNILLGTTYLAMVYDQLGGSAVLATAGYNAGPGRPRAWRRALPGPVEGAIFAEAIPIQETRDYVKNVMANTVYYSALFDGTGQSLKARLGTIAP